MIFTRRKSRKQGHRALIVNPYTKFTQELAGLYRIAGAAQYHLYVGEDENPDFTAAADQSGSLPLAQSISAPVAGTKEVRATVQYENEYGIQSINQHTTDFEIDTAGDLVTPDPTSPENVSLSEGLELKVNISADYLYKQDGSNNADTWLIYATDTGVDPNPASDTPTEIAMKLTGAYERLRYALGPYSASADVRVLVRVQRSGDSVDDGNTTVYQHTVTTVPSAPSGSIFGGSAYEVK